MTWSLKAMSASSLLIMPEGSLMSLIVAALGLDASA
jgi:hypothetical protein